MTWKLAQLSADDIPSGRHFSGELISKICKWIERLQSLDCYKLEVNNNGSFIPLFLSSEKFVNSTNNAIKTLLASTCKHNNGYIESDAAGGEETKWRLKLIEHLNWTCFLTFWSLSWNIIAIITFPWWKESFLHALHASTMYNYVCEI
jgi:hypothetical protein